MEPRRTEQGYEHDGRWFEPDPSRLSGFRVIGDDGWGSTVADRQGGQTREDPDGIALCTDDRHPEEPAHIAALQARPPGVPRWEYKMLKATFGGSLERSLNEVGEYGWEVVSISATSGTVTPTGNKIFALLKRPIPDPPAPGNPPPFNSSSMG